MIRYVCFFFIFQLWYDDDLDLEEVFTYFLKIK
jgi:hypothetical protein